MNIVVFILGTVAILAFMLWDFDWWQRRKIRAGLKALSTSYPGIAVRFFNHEGKKSWPEIHALSVFGYQHHFERALKAVGGVSDDGRLTESQEEALARAAEEAMGWGVEVFPNHLYATTVVALVLLFIRSPPADQQAMRSEWAVIVATHPNAAAARARVKEETLALLVLHPSRSGRPT